MLAGLAVVLGTYYSASATLPSDLALPQATRIYYSDGKTLMAQIGTVTRYELDATAIPDIVKHAAVATEDATFYTNSGIDLKGIARAFVNNVTGGSTQGASTITQQYARQSESLTQDASYTRKIKEAAIAVKMTRTWGKDKILSAYLNTIPFGRGAYGIEAAANAYFNVPASKLTPPQAMVLVGLIKDPNGTEYDPYHPCPGSKTVTCPTTTALGRFEYTRGQMVKLGYITAAQAASPAYAYPTNAIPNKNTGDSANQYLNTPVGFIVRQVMSELIEAINPTTNQPYVIADSGGAPAFSEIALENGGYSITTTINYQAEQAAIAAADFQKPTSPGYKTVPAGTDGELVSIDPPTGRVIAYYGGPDGTGFDYAGVSLNLNFNISDDTSTTGATTASAASSAVGPAAIAALGLAGGHRDPGVVDEDDHDGYRTVAGLRARFVLERSTQPGPTRRRQPDEQCRGQLSESTRRVPDVAGPQAVHEHDVLRHREENRRRQRHPDAAAVGREIHLGHQRQDPATNGDQRRGSREGRTVRSRPRLRTGRHRPSRPRSRDLDDRQRRQGGDRALRAGCPDPESVHALPRARHRNAGPEFRGGEGTRRAVGHATDHDARR